MQQTSNLLPIKINQVNHAPQLQWASNITVTLPRLLANHLVEIGQYNKKSGLTLDARDFNSEIKQVAQSAMEMTRLHAAFTNTQPMSSRLPINYQQVPSTIRDLVAKVIGRTKRLQVSRWAKFPTWPLDLSTDFIADLYHAVPAPFTNKPTPVLLTHDLDSAEGLKNVVHYFLDIEESVGARSSNYIVPCAWQIDHTLLDQLASRGHEVGIHGYDHSNKTPFLSTNERQQRLAAATSLIQQYDIQGYRAPSLLRTKGLLQDLTKFYRYDSSIPTSGGAFPIPNNGCATARPFYCEGIFEIPLSMPRDGSLLFLGYSYKQILQTWIECAERIAKSGGIINLLTHCEYRFSGRPAMRKIYETFLNYLANNKQYQFMLAKDLLTL